MKALYSPLIVLVQARIRLFKEFCGEAWGTGWIIKILKKV